jgi:ABC-type Zn uptake system ZnuABC Zn-binding protein ZnuA
MAPSHTAGGGLQVVASTSTLASLVTGVLGDPTRVHSIVPVGSSPETYQPAPQDIEAVHNADVLVENGAGLESWLQGTLDNARNGHLRIVVCTDGLPVRDGNPHLWMDPVFARAYVAKIRDALVAADPANAVTYRKNAAAYDAKLRALIARTHRKIGTIPVARRAMIIFHNAFVYYNARFGIRNIGVVEVVPGADSNPQHLSQIVALARANHVRAVFAEPAFRAHPDARAERRHHDRRESL